LRISIFDGEKIKNVQIIAQHVAQIRREPLELLIVFANRNTQNLFGIFNY